MLKLFSPSMTQKFVNLILGNRSAMKYCGNFMPLRIMANRNNTIILHE